MSKKQEDENMSFVQGLMMQRHRRLTEALEQAIRSNKSLDEPLYDDLDPHGKPWATAEEIDAARPATEWNPETDDGQS